MSRRLRVVPIPDHGPPALLVTDLVTLTRLSGSARLSRRRQPQEYVQGTLAVDFRGPDDDPLFGPQATGTADLPEVRSFVATLTQALVETMGGARPPSQLRRWLSPAVHEVVSRRHTLALRRGGGPARRAVVRRVRVCEPADGVVEACAVVLDAGRVRAVALRLVGMDGRWVVTALQVG